MLVVLSSPKSLSEKNYVKTGKTNHGGGSTMKEIDAKTKICVLIETRWKHSFFRLIHNAGFNALGINFVLCCLLRKRP